MDIISDILSKIKLKGVVYFKSDFAIPWGMGIPEGPLAQFHMVTKGQCWLKTPEGVIQLFAGDVVVFPHGDPHWLAGEEHSKIYDGKEVISSIHSGRSIFEKGNYSATLICGHFEFDNRLDHPFIQELPSFLHITDTDLRNFSWLKNITDLVIRETGKQDAGSRIIVDKLGEVLFIHILRAYIQNNASDRGFITALRDERISKVLNAIHTTPDKNWQLPSLAQIAGMSRTSFANRFKLLVGDTPHNYLTLWRILEAKELLVESSKTVGEIAQDVGYHSEAAFNRVFKKRVELTPLKYRQQILAS